MKLFWIIRSYDPFFDNNKSTLKCDTQRCTQQSFKITNHTTLLYVLISPKVSPIKCNVVLQNYSHVVKKQIIEFAWPTYYI